MKRDWSIFKEPKYTLASMLNAFTIGFSVMLLFTGIWVFMSASVIGVSIIGILANLYYIISEQDK